MLRSNRMLRKIVDGYRHKKLIRQWKGASRHGTSPHLTKQHAVRTYASEYGLEILVETGTCLGEMVYAMRDRFKHIFSIELDHALWRGAAALFANAEHITILEGDSSQRLAEILANLEEPALFWLDAHYSGGITARGTLETPIGKEIDMIVSHVITTHVVLIDDARNFVGTHDYPTLGELEALVCSKRPDWSFTVADDIIRICPPSKS